MPELHPLLAERWSPHAFDPTAVVTGAELASLLEAARWAPSADDSQPWRFVTGRRDDETYKRILANLADGDQRWADRAAALIVAGYVTGPDGGTPHATAAYDLGQAVAHLTVQAMTLRRHVRQMIRFDRAGLRADLDLPAWVRPYVVVAVGRLGDPLTLPADLRRRELGLRRRRPISELVLR
jgi:nitroreductase